MSQRDFVRALARINRTVVNPLVRPVASRLPGMAVVHHTGRRSGLPFETPVRVLGNGTTFYVMVSAERVPDWVRNLQASGGGAVCARGRLIGVGVPRAADATEALDAASRFQHRWRRVLSASTTYVALATT